MKLSNNFSLNELTKSQTAIRKGIDNTPTSNHVGNLRALCINVLQPVREAFDAPVVVSSGYRGEALNSAIGGSKTSDHCKGMAADIEIPGVDNLELFTWIKDNYEYRQLILEFYEKGKPFSGWIHVSYDAKDNKKQNLIAQRIDGKVVYQEVN